MSDTAYVDPNPFRQAIQDRTTAEQGGNPFREALSDALAGQSSQQQSKMRPGNPAFEVNTPQEPQPTNPSPSGQIGDIQGMLAREQKNETSLNAIIQGKLGKQPFDPKVQDDPLLYRASLARRIDQTGLQDAQTQLEKKYPKGSIVQVPTPVGDVTLYRRNPTEPYRYLGSGAEFIGSNINFKNAGILGATFLSGGGGAAAAALSGAAGGVAGETLDIGQSTSNGYGKNITGVNEFSRAGKAALEGSLNIVPEVAQSFRLPNLGAIARVSPESANLVANLNKEGLWPLSVGQLSDNPLVRATVRQTSATSPILERLTLDQKRSLESSIQQRISQVGYDGVSNDALTMLSALQKDELSRTIATSADTLDKSQLNNMVQTGLQTYRTTSGQALDKEKQIVGYAFKTEGAQMSTMPLKVAVAKIERGTIAPAGEEAENALTTESGTRAVQLAGPTRDIQPYVDTIKALAPQLQNITWKGQTDDAFSQLVEMRKGLYNLMTSSPDPTTRMQAGELFDATYQTINNTQGYSPVLGKAVKDWLQHSSDRIDTLNYFRSLMNSQEPGNVATKLVKPGSYNTTAALMSSLSDTEQRQFKEGFKADLLSNPEQIASKIKSFDNDRRTLGLVLTPQEQTAMVAYGNMMKRFNQTMASKAATSLYGPAENAVRLASEGQTEELDALIKTAGGPDSKTAGAIRAGIYKDILDAAKTTDDLGRTTFDMKAVKQKTQDYLNDADTRLKSVLRPEDVERLQTWNQYASAVGQPGGDTSGVFQRGAIISQLRKPLELIMEPERTALHLYSIINNDFWARTLATPASARILDSIKDPNITDRVVKRLIAAGTASMSGLIDANSPGRQQGPIMNNK